MIVSMREIPILNLSVRLFLEKKKFTLTFANKVSWKKPEKAKKRTICARLSWNYLKFAQFAQKFLFLKDSAFKVTKISLI